MNVYALLSLVSGLILLYAAMRLHRVTGELLKKMNKRKEDEEKKQRAFENRDKTNQVADCEVWSKF